MLLCVLSTCNVYIRANCDHISKLPAINSAEILQLSHASLPKAIATGRAHIQNFLYNSLDQYPSTSKKSASEKQKFIDRCAYNLHTGSKPNSVTHHVVDGVETTYDSHCSRSEYRFSLIDVLSGLHDDNLLYNQRYNKPRLASEMLLQDFSKANGHKCF